MNCRICQSALPDLLLDPGARSKDEVRAHLAECAACAGELKSLQSTMALLDAWQAPEPSPYFDQKLAARLREEQATAPAGWLERMRSRLLFNTGRQFRPAMAGGLALVLLVGGGMYADLAILSGPSIEASATVQDLQILDKNDQAMKTLDQLLQEDESGDESNSVPPIS